MQNLIFLDTETTGNEIGKDRLVQVCYFDGERFFTEYFKAPLPISVKSMSITHITNEDVEDKPPFIGSEFSKVLQEKLENGVLIAHNAQFDISMLKDEGLRVPKFICTLKLARYLDDDEQVPEYNLQFLRYYFGLRVDAQAHDAEGDVKVLKGVFDKLKEIWIQKYTDENVIDRMADLSAKPLLMRRINFGKHAGQTVEEVSRVDRGYLEWLLNAKMENPANEEDWIYTLKYYLYGNH